MFKFVKTQLFFANSNFSANCRPILMETRSKKYLKILDSELVTNMPIASELQKLLTKQSVYLFLAQGVCAESGASPSNVCIGKVELASKREFIDCMH